MTKINIKPAKGKLGVLVIGIGGAVSGTMIGGVELVKKGASKPIGSFTQMGTMRIGDRKTGKTVKVNDFIPLHKLEDIVWGGWDLNPSNLYEAGLHHQVLDKEQVNLIKNELQKIQPMEGVYSEKYVKNLPPVHVKKSTNKLELVKAVEEDIKKFKAANNLEDLVMIWCASTEAYIPISDVHKTLKNFEKGLQEDNDLISPSMIYCYAALKNGIPFINGAPHLCCDAPAMVELSLAQNTPISGKDFKTGQTLMKTIVAPGLKERYLGVDGWYSTNILGNRDGLVLDAPENFKSKEVSKLSVLESILDGEENPELYGNMYHMVRINYYPPKGDNKESWDNIDIFGWLGYKMQIKINFLCRDSILAAPVALDLVLFMDFAKRANQKGVQEWLSFYLKAPQCAPDIQPLNDLFQQAEKMKNNLRFLMGEDLITYLGREYYEEKEKVQTK